MKSKLSFLILGIALALILTLAFISADRYVTFNVREGIIESNGAVTGTSTGINGFNVVGYVCTNADCSSIGSFVPNLQGIAASSSVILAFPTNLMNTNGYVLYFYRTGYIATEILNIKVSGSGSVTYPYFVYLSKKRTGSAGIGAFSMQSAANTSAVVPITATINSAIANNQDSAVNSNLYDSPRVNTTVTRTIVNTASGSLVNTTTQSYLIPYSSNQVFNFNYNFTTAGVYNVTITTNVNDPKVLSSIAQTQTKTITITNPTVPPTPDATVPFFTSLTNLTIPNNQSVNHQITASDPESGIVGYSVNSTLFTINSAGLLRNFTALPIGMHWLRINATNGVGLNASGIIYVNVTNSTILVPPTPGTVPVIAITNPTEGQNLTNQTFTLTATSNQPVSWKYSLNGGISNVTLSGISSALSISPTFLDGNYNLIVYGNNTNGTGSDSVSFEINSTIIVPPTPGTVPIITLTSPQNMTYNITSINLTASSNQLVAWSYSLNGAANVSLGSSLTINQPITLVNGSNRILVYGNNTNGTGINSVFFNVNTTGPTILDTTAPFFTIYSPINGTTYSTLSQLLNISISEPGTIWYTYNGTNVTYFAPISLNFVEGNNVLPIWANDTSGNVNSTVIRFNINTSLSAPTCNAWTYSPWGECQSGDYQTRTNLSASPAGCVGGSPILIQECDYDSDSNDNTNNLVISLTKTNKTSTITSGTGSILLLKSADSASLLKKISLWLLILIIILLVIIALIALYRALK